MKGPLGLLQLLCIIFLSRSETTEGRFLDIRTSRNVRSVTLPEGYSTKPGYNAAYKLYTDKKTWSEARVRCISDGGDLANVATLEKRNRMLNVISQVIDWVHVGIYKPAGGQEWISVDTGLSVTSSLPWFRYDAPDNAWNGGTILPFDGDMKNFNGSFPANSVCEIRIGENGTVDGTELRTTQPTTTKDGTTEETTQASPGISLPEGYSTKPGYNAAYKLYTDGKTWRDARARCISDGGDLADVSTLEKRNRIRNVMPHLIELVYVGIYKPVGGQEWISVRNGLPVTSLPWSGLYNAPENDWKCDLMWLYDGNMWDISGSLHFPMKSVCEIRIDKNKTMD